jgi:AraC-like DNA-binding protein
MNDLVNARKDLDKIKEESVDLTQNTNWARYLREEVQYYYQSKNYNKAYMYLEKYELLRNKFQLGDSLDSNIIKSKVLNKLNRSAEAFDLLEKTMIQIDSLNSIYVSSTIAELQVIYEVDKVKADLEIQKAYLERSKAIVIGLGCILLLSIGIVIIIRKNSKEKERKNKKIYEQYMLMKSYMDGIRSQKDNLTKQDNRDEQTDLAERVHEYIIGTKAFKNENLSRDELALTLGTNRQYLTDAIRKKTGKTFKDYINSIRLDYASQILIENKGASIESIYIEAGFPTRSTFNRLFKEQYEMSPNELRDISRKKEELIISKAETLEDD